MAFNYEDDKRKIFLSIAKSADEFLAQYEKGVIDEDDFEHEISYLQEEIDEYGGILLWDEDLAQNIKDYGEEFVKNCIRNEGGKYSAGSIDNDFIP